jgi:hypothetical protein
MRECANQPQSILFKDFNPSKLPDETELPSPLPTKDQNDRMFLK